MEKVEVSDWIEIPMMPVDDREDFHWTDSNERTRTKYANDKSEIFCCQRRQERNDEQGQGHSAVKPDK